MQEEDLFTVAFGLPLEGEGDGKCLSGLHLIEEVVTRQLKGSKGLLLKKKIAEGAFHIKKNRKGMFQSKDLEYCLC